MNPRQTTTTNSSRFTHTLRLHLLSCAFFLSERYKQDWSVSLTHSRTTTLQFPHCDHGHGRAGAIPSERASDGGFQLLLLRVVYFCAAATALLHSATSNETEMAVDTTWWPWNCAAKRVGAPRARTIIAPPYLRLISSLLACEVTTNWPATSLPNPAKLRALATLTAELANRALTPG